VLVDQVRDQLELVEERLAAKVAEIAAVESCEHVVELPTFLVTANVLENTLLGAKVLVAL